MSLNATKLLLSLTVALSASAVAAENTKPIRLASPGFTGVNIDDKNATFFAEHFAQKLSLQGITVISSNEVKTLIGLERQRQLMGCNESNCIAELADALGADGVITGSIGKFGGTYQVNIKILNATNGSALSVISKKAYGEEDLLEMIDTAAEIAAEDLRQKLRSGAPAPGEPSSSSSSASSSSQPEEESRPAREPERAQAPTPPTNGNGQTRLNNVTFWALGTIGNHWAIEYERAVGSHLALYAQPAYLAEARGPELTAGLRLYPFGLAPQGLFVGGELKGHATFYGAGVGAAGSLGYTARLFELIVLSGGVNLGGYFLGQNTTEPLLSPLDLSFRGHVGFAF